MQKERLSVFSWALYDFANAIFGMNVLALYFALWVTVDKGAQDIAYSLTLGLSMALAGLSMPVLGAISDIKGRRMPFLIFFTCLSVVSLAFIGLIDALIIGLLFFAISNLGYLLSGAVFYNSLLPYVAGRAHIGKVSGYGISLSYMGTIAGLLLIRPIALKFGYQATFIPSAFLFLLFALPCFLFVKDSEKPEPGGIRDIFTAALKNTFKTISAVRSSPGRFNLFIALFLIINAVNTVFIFMSVYLKKVMVFLDSEIITLYIVSNIFSILGALFFGTFTDRVGAKKALNVAVSICCLSMIFAILSSKKSFFWIIGLMAGIAFSGIRVSGRALIIEAFPTDKIGEIFGLVGLLSNIAFIGLLVWGATVFLFSSFGVIKYRAALFVSLIIMLSGAALLQKIEPQGGSPNWP